MSKRLFEKCRYVWICPQQHFVDEHELTCVHIVYNRQKLTHVHCLVGTSEQLLLLVIRLGYACHRGETLLALLLPIIINTCNEGCSQRELRGLKHPFPGLWGGPFEMPKLDRSTPLGHSWLRTGQPQRNSHLSPHTPPSQSPSRNQTLCEECYSELCQWRHSPEYCHHGRGASNSSWASFFRFITQTQLRIVKVEYHVDQVMSCSSKAHG